MMKEYLFDTGVLIDIYKGRERIRPFFEAQLSGQLVGYLSVITEAELWRGIRPDELTTHQRLMEQFVVLPLQSEAARLASSWQQRLFSQGLGWMDAFIVATAKVANLTVLTRDKKLTAVLHQEANFHLYT